MTSEVNALTTLSVNGCANCRAKHRERGELSKS